MKTKLLILLILISQISFAQDMKYKNELIDLAKIYRNFHFNNNPPTEVFDQLNSISSPGLQVSIKFIAEVIKGNNKIATREYLTKPDSVTLKSLYVMRGLNWNMHEANAMDNLILADSLLNEKTDYYELLSCYYEIIFTSVGNKNKPFDMSQFNFTLWDYNLQNDIEKGIFFLVSMDTFGSMIWGYMNIPKPPNYKLALEYIDKYPRYNGQPYYQFLDLNFKDFKLTTDKRKPKESFKKYYLNKYMNTLLYNALCLSQKKKNAEKKLDVMMGSILHNESYWEFYEDPDLLKSIFVKVKE